MTTTSPSDWVKGISLSLAASIIGGASKLAIRKSWLMEEEASFQEQEFSAFDRHENSHGRPSWALRWLGMFGMSVLNPLCCVLAMQYASPSILAPFSGLTLVWILLFSPIALNEPSSTPQKASAGMILLGEVMVAVWGDHTNASDAKTVDAVIGSYQRSAFGAFVLGFLVWFGVVVRWMHSSPSPRLQRFAWGVAGGSITAFGAAATAFGGLLLLSNCMKRYDATYSSAMFVGSFVVSASIMSAIHYDTFQHLDGVQQTALYLSGLASIIAGVWVLIVDNDQATAIRYSTPQHECGMETPRHLPTSQGHAVC